MKAAVLNQLGKSPVYQDFADPIPHYEDHLLINLKAVSIKNIDKLRAGGKHYASYARLPVVVGLDGVGVLENGTRVYAQGVTGMMAEKAVIDKNRYIVLPDNIDDVSAAALPNAVLGATMAIISRGHMQKGHTVLVNGATGVTGRLAVQVAKHYGAAKIIATGRNAESLEKLKSLGADVTISLLQEEKLVADQLKEAQDARPVDLVVDYLWGRPMELIINAFTGGGIGVYSNPVRIVTVGDMAGEHITLPSGILRSSAIEILGSGLGSLSQEDFKKFNDYVLPEMFQLCADGKLEIETQTDKLENIEAAWQYDPDAGKRMVICIE